MLFADTDWGTRFIFFALLMALVARGISKLYARVDGPNSEVTGGVKDMILRFLSSKGGK